MDVRSGCITPNITKSNQSLSSNRELDICHLQVLATFMIKLLVMQKKKKNLYVRGKISAIIVQES